ncbi:DUF5686 and carboxypeptidase regulatory-like domain-containing protein [Lacinutrix salivirga]
MKKFLLLLTALFLSCNTFAQITGTVTSNTNETLPFVNIFIENTYTGTTTNENGIYELELSKTGTYTIFFKYLGYKTVKKEVTINTFPYTLNAVLTEEELSLDEVVVTAGENPANEVIRKAIANRKANLEKTKTYTANYYSRGLLRIINAPEKILGEEVGDLGGGLDSTRSGIIYLSETISKLEYDAPKRLKEKIIASKVSGNNNGFSFNTASDVNYNFYKNTFSLGMDVVSPISEFAFNYYRYKLDGVFYDDLGNLINKIKITPKRENDAAFSGFVYIVENQWSLYAIDVTITGKQVQITPVNTFKIQQDFSYSETDKVWAKISQVFDFDYGLFGFKGDGRFTSVYSDYDFNPQFAEKTFTREILSFEENSNKKDSIYWKDKRPVPLTNEEVTDYVRKDSLEILQKSKPYLDSIDGVNNTFKLGNIIGGYSYQNSHKNTRFSVSSPIEKITFNTVQGWNGTLDLSFRKNYDEFKRYLRTNASITYGEADDRLRATASATYKFNNINRPFLTVSGGVKTEQFNSSQPISNTINLLSTLLFEDNYMKLYEKGFAQINYSQEVFNGLNMYSALSYERRKALFNNTDYVLINEDRDTYTSNNPLDETAYRIAPFNTHNILKLNLNARINFAQDYLSYPDSKINMPSGKYPTLNLGYEKGFGATNSNYNFDQFKGSLYQNINLGNKGNFVYYAKGGVFNNAEDIAFMDYHHFNGNQTNVNLNGAYIGKFKNLPYYGLSTNDAYGEVHLEHSFNGYILNKIPLLNKLNLNLILGANTAFTNKNKPYSEFSIGIDNLGFGKFRFLRVDYVRSYQSGFINDAVLFGISF